MPEYRDSENDHVTNYMLDQTFIRMSKGHRPDEEYERLMQSNRQQFERLSPDEQREATGRTRSIRKHAETHGFGYSLSVDPDMSTPVDEDTLAKQREANRKARELRDRLSLRSSTDGDGNHGNWRDAILHPRRRFQRPRAGVYQDPMQDRFGPYAPPQAQKPYLNGDEQPGRIGMRRIYEPGQGPAGAEHWQSEPGRPGVPRPRDPHR